MKNILLISLIPFILSCSPTSKPQLEYVFDYEMILSEEQEDSFRKLFADHEKKTTNEIVLVTADNWGKFESAKEYAFDFGNTMGIGKKEKDNGVLVVFSSAQRTTWIATGMGTELILTDEIAQKIVDSLMVPQFKESNYYEGLFAGSKAIVDFLEKPENEIKAGNNTETPFEE